MSEPPEHRGRLAAEIDQWYAEQVVAGATVLVAGVDPIVRTGSPVVAGREVDRVRRALKRVSGGHAEVWSMGADRLGCLVPAAPGMPQGAELAHVLERSTRRRLRGRTVRVTHADLDHRQPRTGAQVVAVLEIALTWAGDTATVWSASPSR